MSDPAPRAPSAPDGGSAAAEAGSRAAGGRASGGPVPSVEAPGGTDHADHAADDDVARRPELDAAGDPPAAAAQPAVPLSARELRKLLRGARRMHSDKTIFQALVDGYTVLLATAIVLAMVGASAHAVAGQLGTCASASCATTRVTLGPALAVLVAGAVLRGLLAVGPVVASRASATWLLDTPAGRGRLVAPGYLAATGLAVAVGAVVGLLAGLFSTEDGLAVVQDVGIGALLGAGAVQIAAWAQCRSARRLRPDGAVARRAGRGPRLAVGAVADLLLLGGVAGLVATARGLSLPRPELPVRPVLLVVGVLAVLLAAAVVPVLRRLGRPEVVAGGDLVTGLSGAAAGLDLALFSDVLAARRFRLIGARHSRRGHLRGALAVVEREVLRSARSPRRLLVSLLLVSVPYAVVAAGPAAAGPLVAGLLGMVAVRPFTGGVRMLSQAAGLRRSLPFRDPVLGAALVVLPAVGAACWAVLTAYTAVARVPGPRGPNSYLVAGIVVFAASLAGALRAAHRKPLRYDGPLLSTPMGGMPTSAMLTLVRGPDAVFVAVFALVLGGPALLDVVIALIVLLLVTRTDFSGLRPGESFMERAQKAQEEAQRRREAR